MPESPEAALQACIARARSRWPDLALDERTFAEHVGARVAPDDLATAHVEDLWLACACGHAVPGALAAFEREHAGDIRAVHAQSRPPRPALDDLGQLVRTKLFVGPSPRILEYSGRGLLSAWVRVLGARTLVDMTREPTARESPRDESAFLAVPAPGDDPELEYLKRTYSEELRQAFEEAARALSPEERNVLRDHYAHRLGIDEIAAAHGIHRATAARRVEAAREAVLKATRQLLMHRLKLSRRELESIVRLIESQLHVTIERVFATR